MTQEGTALLQMRETETRGQGISQARLGAEASMCPSMHLAREEWGGQGAWGGRALSDLCHPGLQEWSPGGVSHVLCVT